VNGVYFITVRVCGQ